MAEVRCGLGAIWRAVLLQMLLRMLQMVGTSGVAAADRTLLEVALQDVATAEGVLAQVALVGSLTGVCVALACARRAKDTILTSQKMALQMLQVQVRFVAMWAFVLAIRVLCRGGGRLACGRSWPARVCRQDSATTLLTDNVYGLRLLIRKDRRVRVQRGVVHAHARSWAAQLVCVVLSGSGRQQRRLRVCRRHGTHVRGRGLDGPQRRVLEWGHGATAIWRRGYRRVRRLRRLGVAVVAAVQRRERGGAVEGRQRGLRLLGAIVRLLGEALILGQAGLAEAIGGVHGGGIQ